MIQSTNFLFLNLFKFQIITTNTDNNVVYRGEIYKSPYIETRKHVPINAQSVQADNCREDRNNIVFAVSLFKENTEAELNIKEEITFKAFYIEFYTKSENENKQYVIYKIPVFSKPWVWGSEKDWLKCTVEGNTITVTIIDLDEDKQNFFIELLELYSAVAFRFVLGFETENTINKKTTIVLKTKPSKLISDDQNKLTIVDFENEIELLYSDNKGLIQTETDENRSQQRDTGTAETKKSFWKRNKFWILGGLLVILITGLICFIIIKKTRS
ncbi:hypothetical protein CDIK_2145 [Cucumispora dikerogammari]|nr:hypothetical protein CDIK_2145 [Cucumispora dikerogammari]